MRIIAGKHKGRKLAAPDTSRIRPTTDRLRETLFNILAHDKAFSLHGARVADLFAGTGTLGLEALSRGAGQITFVENDPYAAALVRTNVTALAETDSCEILARNACALPQSTNPYDLVFLDPPYRKGLIEPAIASLTAQNWLTPGTIIVAECGADETPKVPSGFSEAKSRAQGDAKFTIYRITDLNV